MELPNYRMPGAKMLRSYCGKKPGIFSRGLLRLYLLPQIIIWVLQTFDFRLNLVTDSKDSILAAIAGLISPVFSPLGFGDWRISTALITGFMAKSVVSTISVLFGDTTAIQTVLKFRSSIINACFYFFTHHV